MFIPPVFHPLMPSYLLYFLEGKIMQNYKHVLKMADCLLVGISELCPFAMPFHNIYPI